MKERWKTIRTAVWMIVYVILGVWLYVQLMKYFDLPQVMLIAPVLGAAAMLMLKKKSFFVLAGTILISCLYQILAGNANAVARLQTNVESVSGILLRCLSVLLLFELAGMGGGALIRMLPNKDKRMYIRVISCVLGILLIAGPYVAMFRNPIYPILAKKQLKNYAEEHFTDYPMAGKMVYFSMQDSEYICRVLMADGQIRVVGFDEAGNAVQQ